MNDIVRALSKRLRQLQEERMKDPTPGISSPLDFRIDAVRSELVRAHRWHMKSHALVLITPPSNESITTQSRQP